MYLGNSWVNVWVWSDLRDDDQTTSPESPRWFLSGMVSPRWFTVAPFLGVVVFP